MHRFLWPVAMLVAAGVLVGAAAGDTVTVGQTPTPDFAFVENILVLQTSVADGTSYTVPPGDWRATSWSLNVGNNTGPVAAVVATPTGGGNYTIDAVSSVETPTANMLNTFPASFIVHGGSVLGIWNGGAVTDTSRRSILGGDTIAFTLGVNSVPSVGASFATSSTATQQRITVSLTLESLISPEQMISDLRELVAGMGIHHGITNALDSKLRAALAALEADDIEGACTALQDFQNLVNAQTGKKLSVSQAQQLTDAVRDIGEQICFT